MAAQSCSYAMDQLPHEGVFRAAFEAQSLESSATHPRIKLIPGDEILRDDIIPCIERALDRKLDLPPRVILNCFNLDISGVISWEEFRQSLQAMKLMRPTAIASTVASGGMTSSTGSGGGTTRSHKRLMEARRKGRPFGPVPQVASDTPLTSAQVGFISLNFGFLLLA